MMRLLKRLLCAGMALAILLSCAVTALAREETYTYTVRIFAGQQGRINGGEVLVYRNVPYGGHVSFQNSMVSLDDDSKYYVKGIRESGKGSEDMQNTSNSRLASFEVDRDQDYVVMYGLLGDAVEYTIHYQNAAGEALAPSETYVGNVGDKPVIAFLYIEGYQPQAYNLTKTLSANAAENVFTFVYTPVTVPQVTPTVTQSPGATVVTPATPVPEGGTGTAPAPSATPAGAGPIETEATPLPQTATPSPDQTVSLPEGEVPQGNTPEELIDIDEENVPLAGVDQKEDESKSLSSEGQFFWSNIPVLGKILIAVLVLGALAGGLWWLLFWRKRKKDQETQELMELELGSEDGEEEDE